MTGPVPRAFDNGLNARGQRVQNVGTPTATTDGTPKAYVDGKTILGTNSSLMSSNTVYAAGTHLLETDKNLLKIADGSTAYTQLPYTGGSGIEVAYAENATGQTTAVTTFSTYADIPDVAITVPSYPVPVYVEWEMSFTITTAGGGGLYAALMDRRTTTEALLVAPTVGDSFLVGSGSAAAATMRGSYRLSPNSGVFVFGLSATKILDSSSALAASVVNGANQKTWLRAVVA